MVGVKGKIMSLFKTSTTKNYSKPTHVKNVYGGEKKPRKLKIKENGAPKGIMITDIKNLFEQEQENYYKPVRAGNFYSNNYIEYNY